MLKLSLSPRFHGNTWLSDCGRQVYSKCLQSEFKARGIDAVDIVWNERLEDTTFYLPEGTTIDDTDELNQCLQTAAVNFFTQFTDKDEEPIPGYWMELLRFRGYIKD
jgi:hypothetical protein